MAQGMRSARRHHSLEGSSFMPQDWLKSSKVACLEEMVLYMESAVVQG